MMKMVSLFLCRTAVLAFILLETVGGISIFQSDSEALADPVSPADPPSREQKQEPSWLGPVDVVLSPNGKVLWTACLDSSELLAFETEFGLISQRIALPAPPSGMVLSRDGTRLYVTCDPEIQSMLPTHPKPEICAPELLCLDTASGSVLWNLPVGEGPQSPILAPEEDRIYLCARFSDQVEVVQIPKSEAVVSSEASSEAFSPEKQGAQESLTPKLTPKLIRKIPMDREPFACAVTPDGKTLVVTNLLINDRTADEFFIVGKAALVDTETWETRWVEFPNGTLNMRGVCISPDGKYAYVLHSMGSYAITTGQVKGGWINMNSISFIDLQTGERTGTQTLDHFTFAAANPWGIACSSDGKWLVVTHAGTMDVSVIERLAMHENFENSLAPYPAMGATPDHAEDLLPTQKRVFTSGRGPRAVAIGMEPAENGEMHEYAYVANYFSDTVDRIVLCPNAFNSGRTIRMTERPPVPTVERLGESLFNDGQLCFEQWQSCASCHPDGRADGLNWDLLNDGSGNPKSTKSMLYAHKTAPAMAVGVRVNAELAVRKGIEMIHFTQPREEDACAIDAYLMALEARRAPILREAAEDPELHASIQRGRRLFYGPKTQCASCHTGEFFTDGKLHDVGTATTYEARPMDTPTLRECWRTAPYMHDGRYRTILEMLRDGRHGFSAELSEQELKDLEAFVLSL